MATNLQPGQHCCVATSLDNGEIEFGWFCFSRDRRMRDAHDPSSTVRVFFGEWLGSETLSRAEAIEFLHRMRRETNQGEIAFEFNGRFYRIRNFDAAEAKGQP